MEDSDLIWRGMMLGMVLENGLEVCGGVESDFFEIEKFSDRFLSVETRIIEWDDGIDGGVFEDAELVFDQGIGKECFPAEFA